MRIPGSLTVATIAIFGAVAAKSLVAAGQTQVSRPEVAARTIDFAAHFQVATETARSLGRRIDTARRFANPVTLALLARELEQLELAAAGRVAPALIAAEQLYGEALDSALMRYASSEMLDVAAILEYREAAEDLEQLDPQTRAMLEARRTRLADQARFLTAHAAEAAAQERARRADYRLGVVERGIQTSFFVDNRFGEDVWILYRYRQLGKVAAGERRRLAVGDVFGPPGFVVTALGQSSGLRWTLARQQDPPPDFVWQLEPPAPQPSDPPAAETLVPPGETGAQQSEPVPAPDPLSDDGLPPPSGTAILQVDVPDNALVWIDGRRTRTRNWSRHRHYLVGGLDFRTPRAVSIKVTLRPPTASSDLGLPTSVKTLFLLAGDQRYVRFVAGDFKAAAETPEAPTIYRSAPGAGREATRVESPAEMRGGELPSRAEPVLTQ